VDIKELTGGWPVTAISAVTDAATVGVNASFTAVMPFKGTIVAVVFTPSANVTANGTNFRTNTVRNKGTNGLSGTTAVASRAWSAVNSVASTPENFTLSGTPANLEVQAGDVLDLNQGASGTGLIIPAGAFTIYVRPRA
jgi:hypothetical protein